MIPSIAIVGYHDSGKTTVMVNLIRVLKKRGYRVAAVKHAAHGYDMGPPEKDSSRCFAAGADKAAVAGPEGLTVHERTARPLSLSDVRTRITGVDLILVEGFKGEPGPKVGVFRQGGNGDLAAAVEGLVAAVGDCPPGLALPCFSLDQTEDLADFITDYLGLAGPPR